MSLETNASLKEVVDKAEQIDADLQNKKQLIATAVTGKDVPTNGSDSFQKMADNIDSIIVRSPIAEDEIGVVQWEDGSYKGFKETSFNRVTLPVSERKFITSSLNYSMAKMNMDKDRNAYGTEYSRYKPDSILKKISINGVLIWQHQMNGFVERVKFDRAGNLITTGDSSPDANTLVYKLTSNGDLVWVKEFPVPTIQAFTTDDELNVYVGYFSHIDGERFIKLDGSTGEEIKSVIIPNGIYSMDYNAKQNLIVVGRSSAMSIYDKDLNLIKSASARTANHIIFHDDGSVSDSSGSIMSYYDSDLKIMWYVDFNSVFNPFVVNSVLDHFLCSANEIVRYDKFGTKLMLSFETTTKGNAVLLGENLVACLKSGGDVALLQDHFKVTENIVVKTIFDTI